MANVTSTNPISIGTVTDVNIITQDFHVYKIILVSGSTDELVTIKDKNDNIIWEVVGDAGNFNAQSDFPERGFLFNGLKVTALVSGTIYLYTFEHPPVDGS